MTKVSRKRLPLFVVVVRAFPGLEALGGVAVIGLKGFPKVFDADDEGDQQNQAAEKPDVQVN